MNRRKIAVAAAFGVLAWSALAQQSQPTAADREKLIQIADEVKQDVEKLRGWKYKHDVKTDVYTEVQLRAFIEKKLFEEQYGGGKLEATQALLRMIGLIPADCDLKKTTIDVLLNQIGGFYDPDTKSFFMMDRGGYGPLMTRVLVAHELCHALDDQYTDLGALIKEAGASEDAGFAVGAVVEGSATYLMMRYMLQAMKSGKFDSEELARTMKDEMARSDAFLKAPRYFTTLAANYLCGMHFVSNGETPGPALDPQAVEAAGRNMRKRMLRLFKDMPRSSEQILHPEKYWDTDERDDPVVLDDKSIERLITPPGTFVIERNTIGELLCALLTSDNDAPLDMMMANVPSYWTNDAAAGWGGDRFFLLAEGADAAAALKEMKNRRGVWVTMWDTKSDREEFIEDFKEYRPDPGRRLIRVGARVAVFAFGFSAEAAAAFEKSLAAADLDFKNSGKDWRTAP